MKVGHGLHTYEVVPDWAKLPNRIKLGYTHGVVVDSRDRVYIFNQSENAVIVLDRDGQFLNSWGGEFAKGAHGMFLSNEGENEFLYLTDLDRHLVVKTTLNGEILWELGAPKLPDVYQSEEQFQPTDVAVAPNGDVYVCDGYGQNWIHHYSRKAVYIRSWGGKGSDAGKLDCPHGIWVDTRGRAPILLVADRGNQRIQRFTLVGEPIDFITAELRLPCCFYQFGDEIYIPDLLARVTIFDRHNRLITHLGDNPAVWEKEGWPNLPLSDLPSDKFVAPHAVCVDSRGDVYVVEWHERGRLTKLQRLP